MIQEQTTITTETIKTEGQYFTVKTYEQKVTGFCDICGEQNTNNAQALINQGWQLHSRFHLCPDCNL